MRAAIQSMRTGYLSNDYSLHELCKGWLGVQWCKLRIFFEARKVLKPESNRLFTQRDSSVNVFGFALGQFLAGDRSMIAAGKRILNGHVLFEFFAKFILLKRLAKVIRNSSLNGLNYALLFALSGDHDDRNLRSSRADRLQHF